jgi:DeoR family transcriptional regulator, glycerol-3-phosphate regulon repressor
MNLNPRQQRLLDEVRATGATSVEDLARTLAVTPQTVRRDIRQLTDAGLLARFHGGVDALQSTTENIAYAQRKSINATGKAQIGQAIAHDLADGASLILNIGTTTEAVARALARRRHLRVVTNSLDVASIVSGHRDCEVIVAGGVVRARDRGIVGEATVDFIRQFKVDVAVIGISSIEPDGSLRDFDYREVKVAQAIIAQAREVWLAADHTKFTRQAMVEVAHVSQIDALYSDALPPAAIAKMLDAAGTRFHLCAPAGGVAEREPAELAGQEETT